MNMYYCGYLSLLLITLSASSFSHPDLEDVGSSHRIHYGAIKENAVEGDEVELDTPLIARDFRDLTGSNTEDICGYTLYKTASDLPFRVVVTDSRTGSAKILVTRGALLDYEKIKMYTFELSAQSCVTGAHSRREQVHIDVENVNEFSPTWSQAHYSVEATEGHKSDVILKLSAQDQDANGKICRYILLTNDVPFSIDNEGNLRATSNLDHVKQKIYELDVVAEDCGGLRSDKVVVSVEVKAKCRAGWTGISDRVEFTPHDSRKALMSGAELDMCDEKCNLTHVSVTVKLSTEHIGKGCDRDTYSLQSQRKLCGAAQGSIDLLPSPGASKTWTSGVPTDDGKESDQIFALDGHSTAIEVPVEKVSPRLGNHFTVSTWMKHEGEQDVKSGHKDQDKTGHNAKEQILCHSDGDEMNRHHYSLFLHNCRLVLLLRQESDAEAVDPDVFYPAEWRWKIPEVCDGKWHHFVVSVDFPEVRLYIDGHRFVDTKHNPDIVDDWPLRSSKHVHFTKLVVGACWMGGKQRMGQFFKGYLAGLSILKNKTETDGVIECLNNCQEKLDFDGIEDMDTGMSVSMNNEVTSVTISGVTLESVEKLLHRVGYVNTRSFPTPGHRPISIETHAMCKDGTRLEVTPMKTLVMVVEADKPIITLSAAETVTSEMHTVKRGEKIFHKMSIKAHTAAELSELHSSSEHSSESSEEEIKKNDKYRLDSCLIRVAPPLNMKVEHLKYPENLIKELGLQIDISEDGLVLAGADKLENYEEVLSQIQYVNSHPEDVNFRSFVLSCTELNGRFVSNQIKVKVDLVHDIVEEKKLTVAPPALHVDRVHAPQSAIHLNGLHSEYRKNDSQTITGIVVVCVVCVGFIALIIVLGVLRIRNTRRHTGSGREGGLGGEDRAEMEWDHSSLTITVNPMEQEGLYGSSERLTVTQHDDDSESDEEEEECSYTHNDQVSSEEEEEEELEQQPVTEAVRSKELEWDDSTLTY